MPKDCYEIILSHACDLKCGFCSQAGFDPEAGCSTGDAVRRIYTAKKMGYTRLGFSGGEALLRRDLPRLAAAAREVGFKAVRLQTNGMKLSDRALCAGLAAAGLTVCKFTFLGSTAAVHDANTGTKGSFKKSLRGLDNMLALKLAVGVNLLVTRANYRRLPGTLEFFMDRGVNNFVVIYPIYAGGMRKNYKALGISMPEVSKYVTAALNRALAAGMGEDIKALNMPPCMLPGHEDRAVDLYKFNTVVASPRGETWDLDRNAARGKKRGPPCRACFFKRRCRGVDTNYLELFGWKGFKPAGRPKRRQGTAAKSGYLNSMEKCFMEVLALEDGIPTARLLQLARGIPLCQDCRDGAGALTTGLRLVRRRIVEREFSNGRYFWRKA